MNAEPRNAGITGPLKHFVRRLRTWTWRLLAFGLILAAVLLTLARLLLPFASEYRAELEQRVESYLGAEISIGEVDIGWHGFVPRVQLTGVVVEGAAASPEKITFERAYVTLWPAWDGGMPRLRVTDVSLLGLDLSLRIDDRGRIHALGAVLKPGMLPTLGLSDPAEIDAPAIPEALAGVFGVSRLQLLDTTFTVTGPDGGVSRWQDVELRLANAGDRHRLSLVLTPPPEWGEGVRALLEFEGKPTDYRDWQASLFIEGEGLALDRWSTLWPRAPVQTGEGRLDFMLWSDWNDGRLVDAQAAIGAGDLVLENAGEEVTLRFDRIDGNLRLWQPSPSQWQVDVNGLHVRRDGREWSGDGLSLAREDGGAWRLAADFLRLEDLAGVARLLPFATDRQERLAALAPHGDVHGLSLAVGAGGDFRLQADFRDLGWSAGEGIPGMSGLDGRARLGTDGGHVALESSDVGFDGPRLFREPLQLAELSALVRVTPGADGLILDAPRIHVRNEDLRGRGRARIEFTGDESPLLDVHFNYEDGVATATSGYLPTGIMPSPVVSWLDQAFRDGRVERGSFILFGRIGDFPFREHEGVFDVRFDVADVTLHYADGWPAIEDLGGRVHFAGAGLDIHVDHGSVNGVHLQRGRARFADLRQGVLGVDLGADGPLAGMLGVVNDSPLAARFEPAFGGAGADGAAELALDLVIPVRELDATRVGGEVRFDNAALTQPRYNLDLDDLDGSVRFSERSVAIDGLEASLRGRPVRIDAATESGTVTFRATGEFAPDELLPALAGGLLDGSEGRSAWEMALRVPLTADGPGRLEASSDLRGTRIALPPPLGKAAGDSRPLHLEMPLAPPGTREARVRYGDETRLVLELGGDDGLELLRLGLGFGEPAELPRMRGGVRVAGEVARLPLAAWLETAGGDTGATAAPPLSELDLRANAMTYNGHRLSAVHLQGSRDDDGWRLDIASNEADGRIDWPSTAAGGDAVRARLEWVDLALLAAENGTEETGDAAAGSGLLIEPEQLPPLDLRIERLKLDTVTLADFALVTGTGGAGRNIHRLEFRTGHLRASGQGLWRGGTDPRTQLRLTVQSENFGAGLAEIGYPETMANGSGNVTFDLEWPGMPWEPVIATGAGYIEIDIENGVLRQVNPGAGRLLGMFSLETIPFRTLLQQGLIFSRLRGRVDIDDGDAYTGNLRIDSAIGKVRVRGRTGLVARDYDLLVRVQPELSTSLPVIGFLSGGPIAGAAIALLQGVMRNLGQDVEEVSEVEYAVTGPWEDPEVVRTDAEQAESETDSPSVTEPPR